MRKAVGKSRIKSERERELQTKDSIHPYTSSRSPLLRGRATAHFNGKSSNYQAYP